VKSIVARLDHLTSSTRGLLLTAMAWDALIVAFLGVLSRPMQQLVGINANLPAAERVGRIIMVYHALAIPFVAAIAFLILDQVATTDAIARTVRRALTPGFMLTSIGGIGWAYLGRNWILHGLYIAGLTLVFHAGVWLAVGLWPGRRRNTDPNYSHIGSISLERTAFFVTALCLLISAVIGASAGAYFGNGFKAVLAEDIVRQTHNLGERAVIAHLHIMLALIDVGIFLVIVRWFDLKGPLHKIAMPLTILGTVVMSVGCWSVLVVEKAAHVIIYVGTTVLLFGALLMVIAGLGKVIRNQLAVQKIHHPTFSQSLKALARDPLQFGVFFQIIWLQFVMVFPGLYTAVKLRTIFRLWPYEAERRILVGHWHILATASAIIMILLVADRLRARGLMRQILGWGVLIAANVAFTFAAIYEFLPPEVSRDWTTLYLDLGVGVTLIALAIFLAARLVDLFAPAGLWTEKDTSNHDH